MTPTISECLDAVSRAWGVSEADLQGPCREARVVRPRQAFMLMAREKSGACYQRIGRALGGRDHTTIMHGCERALEFLTHDADFAARFTTARHVLDLTAAAPIDHAIHQAALRAYSAAFVNPRPFPDLPWREKRRWARIAEAVMTQEATQ